MKNFKKVLIVLLVSSITYLGMGWESSFADAGNTKGEEYPRICDKGNLKD